MSRKTIVLLHGFASSANSSKAQFFRDRFGSMGGVDFHVPDFNPTSQDFEYMTVTGMINRLRQYAFDKKIGSFSIIASSMGSLVGLHYAHRFGAVGRLLLLAPVLFYGSMVLDDEMLRQWEQEGSIEIIHNAFNRRIPVRHDFHRDGLQYARTLPPPSPVEIIHGRNDETVPVERSREYAAAYPERVTLIELESDHMLHDRLDLIWDRAATFLFS